VFGRKGLCQHFTYSLLLVRKKGVQVLELATKAKKKVNSVSYK
jgi:hypothetical protein